MSVHTSRTAGFGAFVLTTFWAAVAVSLATVLSPTSANMEATAAPSIERRSWHVPIRATGADPCTGEPVAAEVILSIDTARDPESGRTDVDIRLEDQRAGTPEETIPPLARRFAPYMTPVAGVPYVHPLRTPLASPNQTLELLVELQGEVGELGAASFSVTDARIDGRRSPCAPSPIDPPAQPITQDSPSSTRWRSLALLGSPSSEQ
jgi:hypothetical protein